VTELLPPQTSRDLRAARLTYAEVGATAGALPPGYHHQTLAEPVGRGSAQFEAAARSVLGWHMHERAGLRPQVSDPAVRQGSVAVLRPQLGPLSLRVPVRVVRVLDEPHRRGFAYGTLAGHPERGEESFVVELTADSTVVFHLVAFSRAGRWFTRLGGPVARAGQRLIGRRYLSAVREAAQSVADREAP